MHILVVGNDPLQAEAISAALSSISHAVTVVVDGDSAVRCFRTTHVDAIVLDWQVREMGGIELLHYIRARGDTPCGVLFVTNHADEIDVVRALEAGAYDYVVKPFRAEELAARVNAIVRRVASVVARNERLIKAGYYTVDSREGTVTLRGSKIDLTNIEFQIVASLFSNLGKPLSRELLATTAWGNTLSAKSRSLDTHIYRIRRKLELGPKNGLRLSTVYSLGYRLDLS